MAVILILLVLYLYPLIAIAKIKNPAQHAEVTEIEKEIKAMELQKPRELSPRELISIYAEKYGVSDPLAYKIALCESRNYITGQIDPLIKNPTSTASGVFQFVNKSWNYYGAQLWGSMEGKDVFNPKQNIELAMYVMSKRGTKDWEASRYCWEN